MQVDGISDSVNNPNAQVPANNWTFVGVQRCKISYHQSQLEQYLYTAFMSETYSNRMRTYSNENLFK